MSTSATAPTPVNGTAYNIGDAIGTGTVVDIDTDATEPILVSTEQAKYDSNIIKKRNEYIIKSLRQHFGLVVKFDHSFTGTLIGIKENNIHDFKLVIEDQNGDAFDVDFDKVEFE